MKIISIKRFAALSLFIMFGSTQAADLLAFPSAEGFGRYTLGARAVSAPEVYHVTNLNDSGVGSFRDAVSKSGRIVVFDVSGIIKLSSTLVFSGNSIIAGQTAPGDGIMLYGDRVSFSGANNLIVRYLRIRMGIGGTSGKDAAGVANGKDMIFDHVSVSWGRDETFSINWDSKGTEPANITIQNSIISQGLQTHSCGGLIQTDGGVTLFRNLYIDNKTRNPKVKGLNQFVNNVVYNWGGGGGYIMGGSTGDSWAAIEDNYFIKGPSTGSTAAFVRATETFQVYQKNNMLDYNLDGSLNGSAAEESVFSGATNASSYSGFTNAPNAHPIISAQTSAEEAYKIIVEEVGASYPKRDEVDTYIINELKSLGTKGALISNESELGLSNGVGRLASGTALADTDNDGIPDDYESQMGLNKNDPKDALTKDESGYLYIEKYLNSLVEKSSEPQLILQGISSQTLYLGESIQEIIYSFTNCTSAQVTGLPQGVSGKVNATEKTLTITGVPSELGKYSFVVTSVGGEGNAKSLSGEIKVLKKLVLVESGTILSSINAAHPIEGDGAFENKNEGFVEDGYYNFTNQIQSDGVWKITSDYSGDAVITFRFANGGSDSRDMYLSVNEEIIGAVPFNSTASWSTWDSLSLKIILKEGVNTIRLESITSEGGPNLDQMCFNVENISLYDERESIQRHKQEKFSFSIESGNLFSLVDGNAEVVVMNVEGKLLFKQHQKVNAGMNRFAVNKNHLPAGVYLVQLKINQKMISVFQWNLR